MTYFIFSSTAVKRSQDNNPNMTLFFFINKKKTNLEPYRNLKSKKQKKLEYGTRIIIRNVLQSIIKLKIKVVIF